MTGLWIAVLSLTASLLPAEATTSAQPRAVGIYTFSRDTHRGFKDERLDTFRRELGKYASPVMELAYSRESAQITVQFLGQGELAIELGTDGEAVRHLWTPDETAPRMWAVVRMGGDGHFSKEFSVRGSSGRDLSRLARDVGEWLQQNSGVIRESDAGAR